MRTEGGWRFFLQPPFLLFRFGLTVGTEFRTTYQYEPERNLRTQIKNGFGSQTVSQYDYGYNEQGYRTSLVTDGSTFGGVMPGPDAQVADYMTNSLNQYTDITTTVNSDQQVTDSPKYDDDGNLTEISDYPGSLKYSYNAENRLVSAAPELPMQGDIKVEFLYDYMGRRVKKTVSVWNGSWTWESEKLFVYNGWNMICEITSENSQPATEKYYVWGLDLSQSLQGAGGIGGLIATLDNSASVVYYYFYDANGNVGQLVNTADGSIAAHYEYDPFGNTIKAEGEYKDSNPYRFSTKFFDAETGLYYYGFRYYSAELGRWLNRDPTQEAGGYNLYVFVENNAVNHFDLLGLWIRKSPNTHIWVAQAGDTLSELAMGEYSGNEADRECLWPVGDTEDNGYPDKVRPCDRYDASNLDPFPILPPVSLKVGVAPERHQDYESVFGPLLALKGEEVANKIKEVSGEGSTPISFFLIAGHGGNSGKYGGVWSTFTAQRLVNIAHAPTFSRAKMKKGPLRCWFTKSAMALFYGCNSGKVIAQPFAQKVLRQGAYAWGINQEDVSVYKGRIYYDFDQAGNFQSTKIWEGRPEGTFWTMYEGKL
ncbi:MAG: RHS repeat-associated core domain-containing protein [Desulfobacteraceae bacterium]|nr:RHS repeat-associated core domain-containing protein [Desulfobacteraceae bacterium]